jgi:hypothetical protein
MRSALKRSRTVNAQHLSTPPLRPAHKHWAEGDESAAISAAESTSDRKLVPFLPPYEGRVFGPPLGLRSLAASLREAGFEPLAKQGHFRQVQTPPSGNTARKLRRGAVSPVVVDHLAGGAGPGVHLPVGKVGGSSSRRPSFCGSDLVLTTQRAIVAAKSAYRVWRILYFQNTSSIIS